MEIIDLKATKESINVKLGGVITYDTDITTAGPGFIILDNQLGEYGVTVLNQYHPGGPVKVLMRATGQIPVKKYNINDVVAKLVVL